MSITKDNEYNANSHGKTTRVRNRKKIKTAYSQGDTSLDLWKRLGLHDSKEHEQVKYL